MTTIDLFLLCFLTVSRKISTKDEFEEQLLAVKQKSKYLERKLQRMHVRLKDTETELEGREKEMSNKTVFRANKTARKKRLQG